ncbi:uncharacterized protein A4U43_C07F15470 [Asparagus officinalis]|uniref:Uncharacterized protein n=1 Tax=Asparagus officinalis TaxID=4686 RepID=A0A5P1EF52_ASPOF|nr:uncharacterized protein A4U43_C07F15470 [Asparagus officinalis]
MDEDEAELLSLTRSLSPSNAATTSSDQTLTPPIPSLPRKYRVRTHCHNALLPSAAAAAPRAATSTDYEIPRRVRLGPRSDQEKQSRIFSPPAPRLRYWRVPTKRLRVAAPSSPPQRAGVTPLGESANQRMEAQREAAADPMHELAEARREIARFSVGRARVRIGRARRRREDPDEDEEGEAKEACRAAGEFVLECSEIGDDRPLSGCSFSRDGLMLATCSWSGIAKIWSMPQVKRTATLKGHRERATDIVFSPVDDLLVTASADRTAKLWKPDGSLLKSFDGHLDRLARVAFHPSGKYLGTASFDKTWRLWDINTGLELLLQEGHSRSVYGISFHPDGSLAASCGLDALTRVWDLRTGRSILALEGHVKPVLGVSFSPNGYRLATGSEDNTCRIWDLRKRKCEYTIPAHSHLISQVKYEPQEGYFLATASYDMKAMVWSGQDFKPVKTLVGHEAKVTGLDIRADGQQIATVAYDRTIKIWSSRSSGNEKNSMDID